jgi:CBS domain containing-hemolysin-like protein
VASARTPIEVAEQVLGIGLTFEGLSGDVDTLGGLIMTMAGSMPKRGQVIAHPSGVTFEIMEAGPRRLHTVRITKPLALAAPDTPLLLPSPESEREERPGNGRRNGVHGARAA